MKRDAGGVALDEAMLDVGAGWWRTKGPIWERIASGRYGNSRIDLVFYKGGEMVKKVTKVKLLSDHWGLLVDMEGDNDIEPVERVVVDWDRVDKTVEKAKKKEEVNEGWYWELKGDTAYNKLLEFRRNDLKMTKTVARSKRWWDKDLTKQLKKVRRVRRGEKTKNVGGLGGREKRLQRWRRAAAKLKWLVREKKEKCWRTFYEEHGRKDPWEVVRWGKDPYRLKTRIRNLRDLEGTTLGTDEQKAEGLVGDLFGWNKESEVEGPQESVEYG